MRAPPEIVFLQAVVKLDRDILQVLEPPTLISVQRDGCIPGFTPVGSPFGDEAGIGRELDRVQTQLRGFDHHLLKPIDFQELESIVRSVEIHSE